MPVPPIKPMVGSMVHYKNSLGHTVPGVVIGMDLSGAMLDLTLFLPEGKVGYVVNAEYSDTDQPGCWFWPVYR